MSDQHPAQILKSHICVILFDVRGGANEAPDAVWSRLKVFVNAYLSKNRRSFAAIVLYGTDGVQVVYPPTQQHQRKGKHGVSKEVAYVDWTTLSWPVRLKEINVQMNLFPEHFPASTSGSPATISAALSIGLSIANKFLDGQKLKGVRGSARILMVHRNSTYLAKEYLAMMNCIFCAEKLRIPIDACALTYDSSEGGSVEHGGSNKLETLTQAASITNGLYFELGASQYDSFLQWLFTIFFAHTERRDLVCLHFFLKIGSHQMPQRFPAA